ncbi:PD-(D/E)XK nuclease family protein [Candidatus Pacearchaeota archaeon]|nr:PD-(D/E)XK nuclease family protein [Candidatus Pacearchaeota archaeon]
MTEAEFVTERAKNKPQLHVSMLDMMSRCGVQFQRRYGARFGIGPEDEIIAPGIALATGISVHKAVEANLRNKMASEDHTMLMRGQVSAIARDVFQGIYEGGMMFSDDEAGDIKGVVGTAIDQTIALAELHYDNLAPAINPVAVEERFVIALDNYPYDLAGQKDVVEENAIRDTKTRANSPPEGIARTMQFAMYALDTKIKTKFFPTQVIADCLVKTKTPKIVSRSAVPDQSWIDPLFRRIERATEIIQSVKEGTGQFTPADPENWACTKKYCGYAATCPFASGK